MPPMVMVPVLFIFFVVAMSFFVARLIVINIPTRKAARQTKQKHKAQAKYRKAQISTGHKNSGDYFLIWDCVKQTGHHADAVYDRPQQVSAEEDSASEARQGEPAPYQSGQCPAFWQQHRTGQQYGHAHRDHGRSPERQRFFHCKDW